VRAIISAHIEREDLQRLRSLAELEDRSVSSLIRRAIRDYITRNSEAAPVGGSAEAHGGARRVEA
jgi:predicted transcriptional regulator